LYSASSSIQTSNALERSLWITKSYLPPSRGNSPDFTLAFTSTHFTISWKVEGGVDLDTAVRVHNPCPRLYIAVVVVINTRPWWASILAPNTPQLSVLPLDHCDLVYICSTCNAEITKYYVDRRVKYLMASQSVQPFLQGS